MMIHYTKHLLRRLRRMWGALSVHVGRIWGACGRALVACVWLKVKRVDLYRRFYNEPEKGKEGPFKGKRKNRIYIRKTKEKKRGP